MSLSQVDSSCRVREHKPRGNTYLINNGAKEGTMRDLHMSRRILPGGVKKSLKPNTTETA